MTLESVETQLWVTKAVRQRIPSRRARNSKTPTTTETVPSVARYDQLMHCSVVQHCTHARRHRQLLTKYHTRLMLRFTVIVNSCLPCAETGDHHRERPNRMLAVNNNVRHVRWRFDIGYSRKTSPLWKQITPIGRAIIFSFSFSHVCAISGVSWQKNKSFDIF